VGAGWGHAGQFALQQIVLFVLGDVELGVEGAQAAASAQLLAGFQPVYVVSRLLCNVTCLLAKAPL